MHTIIAFSDSHCAPLPAQLRSVASEADFVFFLGDGMATLSDMLLQKGFHAVTGNCDSQGFRLTDDIVEIDGMRILLTHGHRYYVKRDLLTLALRAKELNCSCAFYGHTHIARIDEYDGVTLICPGSPVYPNGAVPTYAFAAVHNGKLTAKIVNL